MPYELWHGAAQAQPSTQAFIFDGWSHEPLVIDPTPETRAVQPPQEPVPADRKAVRPHA